MSNTISRIIGEDPGEAINNLIGGANRALAFSSNLHLDRDSRLSKTITALSIATSVASFIRTSYEFLQDLREDRTEYTIKIPQNGSMYDIVQQIALDSVSEKEKTNLVARSSWDDELDKQVISVIFDDDLDKEVTIRGHRVFITISVYSDQKNGQGEADSRDARTRRKTTMVKNNDIYITCKSVEARDAVLAELEERIVSAVQRDSRLYTAGDWGSFATTTMSKRHPDSVILADGQMDRVLNHIQVFLDNEKTYADLGIPFHTGILLHGPPGTGKTSITSVLSDHFGLDVYQISLNSVNGDNALAELFSDIDPKSIVLFEDVDVSPSASDRDSDEKERVSMSGLLNVLDGNLTPHGVISILTTNHIESLDDAVLRPGRIDLTEEFSYLTQDQLERTCKHFMGYIPENLPAITQDNKITPAEILGVFRASIMDIPATEPDLIIFLKAKIAGELDADDEDLDDEEIEELLEEELMPSV